MAPTVSQIYHLFFIIVTHTHTHWIYLLLFVCVCAYIQLVTGDWINYQGLFIVKMYPPSLNSHWWPETLHLEVEPCEKFSFPCWQVNWCWYYAGLCLAAILLRCRGYTFPAVSLRYYLAAGILVFASDNPSAPIFCDLSWVLGIGVVW